MLDCLHFDGPPTWHVFGVRYVVLTDSGHIKEEGEGFRGDGHDSSAEALASLDFAISDYIKNADQVAWRRRPEPVELNGRWFASCRLAKLVIDRN